MCVCVCVGGGGGGGGGARKTSAGDASRYGGLGGILPQIYMKFKSPEMPFPEAISSSRLNLVVIFKR